MVSKKEKSTEAGREEFDALLAIDNVKSINDTLTSYMADQRHMMLIKGDRLEALVSRIFVLAQFADEDCQLLSAAALGRLAAVARGRESQVYENVSELFYERPLPLDSLQSGDEKYYASIIFSHVENDWLLDYCLTEALALESAEKARKELLKTALSLTGNFSDWCVVLSAEASQIRGVDNLDTRYKRIRRIFLSIQDILSQWQGDLGEAPGRALADCMASFVRGKLDEVDQDTLYGAAEALVSILLRIIEIRFSFALQAETFSIIERGKKSFGAGLWGRFLNQSDIVERLRIFLLEAALVLARQTKTDDQIMGVLLATYTSKPQVSAAMKRHFKQAQDIDPDVREWWFNAGVSRSSKRKVEHKVGNSEDQQIGLLLIEVESSKEAMNKLERAVVPFLEISDPILAATVKKAAVGYSDIAQKVRRLARMRKLTKTDIKGDILEYNPLEQEMLGEKRTGVRMIKVVREGVLKKFGGKIKTLIKPWVEPAD